MDATKRINDLIVIIGQLAAVLERENAALKERRTGTLKELTEEKARLARIYETRFQAVADERPDLDQVDPDSRERLRAVGAKADVLLKENGRLLKVAIAANRRVVDLIAEAVKASAPGPGTYTAAGAVGTKAAGATPRSVAFSLDRTL